MIQKTLSEFYNKILYQLRSPSEYFRVGLYGQKFPHFLRVSFDLVLFITVPSSYLVEHGGKEEEKGLTVEGVF